MTLRVYWPGRRPRNWCKLYSYINKYIEYIELVVIFFVGIPFYIPFTLYSSIAIKNVWTWADGTVSRPTGYIQ